jgi:hypothetical protein
MVEETKAKSAKNRVAKIEISKATNSAQLGMKKTRPWPSAELARK